MPTVTVRDGQKIHVRVVGSGEPVLLLHGIGMQSSHWLPFILRYRRRFQLFMPDFRGSGRSASVRLNQTDVIQNHMEDVQDIVAHFELSNVRLVGYSMGATTSLHWQRVGGFDHVREYLHIDQSPCVPNQPDWRFGLFGEQQEKNFADMRQLDKLLEDNPEHPDIHRLPYPVRKQAVEILGGVAAQLAGKSGVSGFLVKASRSPWLLSQLLPTTSSSELRAYLACYLKGEDYRPSLKDCETPVTVITGMRSSPYHPEGQALVAELVTTGKVVRFEKSGHVPLLNEPVKFSRELGRFLLSA